METIIIKSLTRNDTIFSTSTKRIRRDNYKFFALQSFGFVEVETASEETPNQLAHGHKSGFTRNIKRSITMEFGAFAHSQEERFDLLRQVNRLFEPPASPTLSDQGYHELSFVDPQGKTRRCQAKVTTRPQPRDFDNENRIEFRVTLLVKDTSRLTGDSYTLSDTNHIQSHRTPALTPFACDYDSAQRVTYSGVSEGPVSVSVKAVADDPCEEGNLFVRSIAANGRSRLLRIKNLVMQTGDMLTIDGASKKVLLNGFDISQQATISSVYPSFLPLGGSDNNTAIVDCGTVSPVLEVVWSRQDVRN